MGSDFASTFNFTAQTYSNGSSTNVAFVIKMKSIQPERYGFGRRSTSSSGYVENIFVNLAQSLEELQAL
ncbi:hypothetical protein Tco_0494915 [Tanacetum coccineum]